MSMKQITEKTLNDLRACMAARMSPYRMAHTLGVEKMTARLAALFAPDDAPWLCAAALLHDITKEEKNEKQLQLLAAAQITLRPAEAASPKTWHAITAPLVIAAEFPAFATEPLLSAVRWHTTGRAGMTLGEAIVYLADYIEEGRSFPDCVTLREMFWGKDPAKMDAATRQRHLCDVLLCSFDMTVADILSAGGTVCLDTLAAREDLKKRKTLA